MSRIYLSPPHLCGREAELVRDAIDSNWVAPLGPHVDAFECEMAATVGVAAAAALSSGTGALHLALILANVGSGDDVLCSTLTFAASANAVTYVGARPVFVDADEETWNIDPDQVEEVLRNSKTSGRPVKAMIAVDLYGQCADYERLESLCAEYGVTLIEDAAESLGASYRGRPAGSFGKMAVLSFNGNKIITTSGGGMLVSDDVELIQRARYLATQARDPAPHYEHSVIGFNYRMSNLLAAVGRGQLTVLEDRVAARRKNFEAYRMALEDLPGLRFMPESCKGKCNRWLTCLTVDPDVAGLTREDLRTALEAEDIEARPVWKPMHMQPVYRDCPVVGGQVAERLFEAGLCLPSGSSLEITQIDRVVTIIRERFVGAQGGSS